MKITESLIVNEIMDIENHANDDGISKRKILATLKAARKIILNQNSGSMMNVDLSLLSSFLEFAAELKKLGVNVENSFQVAIDNMGV